MYRIHHCLWIALATAVFACSAETELEQGSVTEQGIVLAQCTATAECCDSSRVTCSGRKACFPEDFDAVSGGRGWVQCDGERTYCTAECGGSSGPNCPASPEIHEFIHPCYPSMHPHGRYGIRNPGAGATYEWSGNVTFTGGSVGTYVQLKPKSIGGFTVSVTASKPGCPTVTSSASYYAESCTAQNPF